MNRSMIEFISIAVNILPQEFNGQHQNLQTFIDCLDLLKIITIEAHEQIAVTLIKSRLTNYTRHWVTNENSIDQIIETLKQRVSHESSKLVRALLKNSRQDKKTAVEYCNEIEKLTRRLEFAFTAEKVPIKVAQRLSIEFAVESLTENANNINVCMLLKAGNFTNLNDLFEKFITLSTEIDTPGTTMNIISNQYQFKKATNNNCKRNYHAYSKDKNITLLQARKPKVYEDFEDSLLSKRTPFIYTNFDKNLCYLKDKGNLITIDLNNFIEKVKFDLGQFFPVLEKA